MTPFPIAGPACRRFTLGSWRITALADGTTSVDLTQAVLPHPALASLAAALGLTSPVTISINAFVLEDGHRRVLLDTGAGDLMGASAGRLLASLAQAGYEPAQFEAVLLTHIHGDHSGGLLTTGDDNLAFPNATLYVNDLDARYWLSEAEQQRAPAARQRSFANARRKVLPYQRAGRLRTFLAGELVLPGIGMWAQPGHTPGHTYYTLAGAGADPGIVFCADLAHLLTLQLADPTIALIYDVDPAQAVAARQQFLAEASAAGYWLAAAHAPFPGIGRVEAAGAGYRWVAISDGQQAL